MKKELTALCVAIIVLNGCSGNDSSTETQVPETFGTQASALFGENGGDPWGSEAAQEISESTPIPGARFGRALAVGTINGNTGIDIVSSTGDEYSQGKVIIKWDNAATPATFQFTDSETDNFGADIAVGKFCPESATYDPAYDMVIASAPGANEFKGGFAIIHKRKANNSVAILKKFEVNASGIELAGMHIAVGDVDGDGKADLVYQSMPADADGVWLPPKVSVVLDICNRANNAKLTPNASVEAVSGNNLLGSALYIADLDGKGKPEIIAVDENYFDSANTEFSPNGAIFFYHYIDGKLVESRKPIIGEMNEKSAAQISSVAFADIDGDGDLDLIVGEPMLNTTKKREGRVRSYTNPGAGMPFDDGAPLWSAVSDRGHALFGTSVTVSDVNSDGVQDLIVGAPGFRRIGESEEYSQGYVYVYMGTKDGSIFSKEPFWTYVSPVETKLNDSFGYRVAAADIDKKAGSWHDLIVAAPGAGSDVDNLDAGRISVFSESSGFCYTANRCLVEGACYEKNEVSKKSKCMVCDPTENNFGFVELKCSGAETACQNTATCDPVEGCVMTNKPDGTECGEISCSADNSLSEKVCKSGICEENLTECGIYVCDASLASCPDSCGSDADCISGYVCDAGVCSEAVCKTDSDCEAGYVCKDGVCEEFVCKSDSDCEAGYVCKDGVCEELECQSDSDCEAGYVCKNGSCEAFVCQSDADCENDYVCENGACVPPVNLPPVITLAESMSVSVGGSVNMKATVTDPEGDDLEYNWSCTSSSGESFTISGYNTNSATLTVSEKETAGNTFLCTIEVTDAASNVVTADTLVTVEEKSSIVITVPTDGDVYYDTHVAFSGTANVKGNIRVMEGSKLVCMGSVQNGKWNCEGNLTYGEHTVRAFLSTDSSQASEPVTFEIVEDILNHPPVIVMTTEYFALPGSSVILDASASYDPDGDDIFFKWGGGDVSLLSDTTSSSPLMTVPEDAEPETTYSYTLYVTDSHNEISTATVTITALELQYNFDIESPAEGSSYVASECNEEGECRVTVSGVADLTLGSDVVVVGNLDNGEELCVAQIVNGKWECDYWTKPGNQNIYATWSTDWAELETERSFNVVAPLETNLPPVIVLADVITGTAGSSVVLDASASYDPNPEDSVTYEWSGSMSASLSDMKSNAPSFIIPEEAKSGDVFDFDLVATDNHGDFTNASTKVVVVPNEGDSYVQILTPEEGATVNNSKVLISGVATPGHPVFVFDKSLQADSPICSLKSDDATGEWGCEAEFKTGANTVRAELMDLATVSTVLANDTRNFIVMTSDEPIPVIESPETGDTISVRPTVSGTIDANSGEVDVWYAIDDGRFVLLCKADVQFDGTWVCTAGYDLLYSTEYTIRANWKFNDETSNMSDPVIVTTKGPDVADITLISPPDGSVLSTNFVVFAGNALPLTSVDVYYGLAGDSDLSVIPSCMTNVEGYWACPDVYMKPGEYVAYADDSSDSEVIPSNKVFFTIDMPEEEFDLPKSGKVRGGSCSMTTTPSNHFGWLALAAGFAGIFFIRRRRA